MNEWMNECMNGWKSGFMKLSDILERGRSLHYADRSNMAMLSELYFVFGDYDWLLIDWLIHH